RGSTVWSCTMKPPNCANHRLAALAPAWFAGLLFASTPAHAGDPTLNWPGTGACAGTLQACVDSAATGWTVLIDDAAADIDEDIVLERSIRLRSNGPLTPEFVPGRGINGVFGG